MSDRLLEQVRKNVVQNIIIPTLDNYCEDIDEEDFFLNEIAGDFDSVEDYFEDCRHYIESCGSVEQQTRDRLRYELWRCVADRCIITDLKEGDDDCAAIGDLLGVMLPNVNGVKPLSRNIEAIDTMFELINYYDFMVDEHKVKMGFIYAAYKMIEISCTYHFDEIKDTAFVRRIYRMLNRHWANVKDEDEPMLN